VRRWRFGITPKLTLVFVLFAAVLLSGLGALAYTNGRASLDAATKSELLSKSADEQAALNNWVDERLSDLTGLADSPSVIDSLATLITIPPWQHLNRRVLTTAWWTTFAHGQAPGSPFWHCSSSSLKSASDRLHQPDEEGKFEETLPYFINGQPRSPMSRIYITRRSARAGHDRLCARARADGRLLGVLAGWLNLVEMNAIIQQRTGLQQTTTPSW